MFRLQALRGEFDLLRIKRRSPWKSTLTGLFLSQINSESMEKTKGSTDCGENPSEYDQEI